MKYRDALPDSVEEGEFLTLKSVVKLFDATILVLVLTAALYFWGYIYYTIFTETVGVRYQGIELSIQDYLVASWRGVIFMLLLVIAGLWLLHALNFGAYKFVNWLGKRIQKKESTPEARWVEPPYAKFAMAMTVAVAVLWGGVIIVLYQAQKEGRNILKAKIETVIRDSNGHPIEGRFIYLRDFGSALLVREMSPDLKDVVGSRWFKAGSYTGYTLLEAKAETSAIAPSPAK